MLLATKTRFLRAILESRKDVELRRRRYRGWVILTNFRESYRVFLEPLTDEPIPVEEIPDEILSRACISREEARGFGDRLYLHYLKLVDGV